MDPADRPASYRVPLSELVRSARVPLDEQVQAQPEPPPTGEDRYDDAAAMGLPRLPGAGVL